MSSQIVHVTDDGCKIVAGLNWRVLPTSVHHDAGLREVAKERSASYAVRVTGNESETQTIKGKAKQVTKNSTGLFITGSDDKGPEKNTHSIAACFAKYAAANGHAKALLVCQIWQDLPLKSQFVVVAIENGLPVLDAICQDEEKARKAASGYISADQNTAIYAEDASVYTTAFYCSHDLLAEISASTSRQTLLSAVPIDIVTILIVVSVLTAILAGYYLYDKEKKLQAKRAAEAARIAADPVPKYMSALALKRKDVGIETNSLVQSFVAASKIATGMAGWSATKIDCAQLTGCVIDLKRSTGTYNKLVESAGKLSLSVKTESINLNEAKLSWAQKFNPRGLDTVLPDITTFISGKDGSTLQNWMTAKLNITVSPALMWPQVPEVPANFKTPGALRSGKIEVNSVALPQMVEVFTRAPSNVVWTGWTINIGEASPNGITEATGRIKGDYYVNQ
jgi:hypothetical protein